jgi:hypothetical protein
VRPLRGKGGTLAAPIRIGRLDAAEASDLVHALAARGLIGRSIASGGARWVEVCEAREETRRLLADVTEAVETWLADRARASLEIRVEDRVEHVTVDQALREALRARITARRRQDDGLK